MSDKKQKPQTSSETIKVPATGPFEQGEHTRMIILIPDRRYRVVHQENR